MKVWAQSLRFHGFGAAGEAERLLAEARALYADALAAGYALALRLHTGNADARVGAAETHVALGKLAAAGARSACLYC